jgi:hypothetical protein
MSAVVMIRLIVTPQNISIQRLIPSLNPLSLARIGCGATLTRRPSKENLRAMLIFRSKLPLRADMIEESSHGEMSMRPTDEKK